MLINNLVLPLTATILIEAVVVYLMGWRGVQQMLLIAAVNAVTNPFMNFIGMWIVNTGFQEYFYFYILPLELLLIPVEWRMLSYALPGNGKGLLKLSVVMNVSSFLLGLLIF